jgi:hypothetical protein
VRHTPLCRTFGAHLINKSLPGLTAGPIDCQPFGPSGWVYAISLRMPFIMIQPSNDKFLT